jgi:hypothetical protein
LLKAKVQPRKEQKNLASDWFIGKTEEERTSFAELLRNSNVQFDPLKEILGKKFDESLDKETDVTQPGWERVVLHGQGYRQALKEVYKLLP